MSCEFKFKRRVEFADTDMAGIMHFSNFFRYMEMAEHAFYRSLGVSAHVAGPNRTVGWPRIMAHCDYQHPLRFEDEVEVHLRVRSKSKLPTLMLAISLSLAPESASRDTIALSLRHDTASMSR